jgi:hypothetical protein
MSFDACGFVPAPDNDVRCGLRGVRISPIPWRGENAGGDTTAGVVEKALPVGALACSGFVWLGDIMKGAESGGGRWLEFVVTPDNEML